MINIVVNKKWSNFLVYNIATTIGDGLDSGQLVSPEIRNNYREKRELVQIPRWITNSQKRAGKEHSLMIIALPRSYTTVALGLKSLHLFDRRFTLETYLNIREVHNARTVSNSDTDRNNAPMRQADSGIAPKITLHMTTCASPDREESSRPTHPSGVTTVRA